MALEPGYGATPVEPDDLDALTETALQLLGSEPTKFALFDLEQAIEEAVSETVHRRVLDGDLQVGELVSDTFLRDLHSALYEDIWQWAGRYRKRELSIGVAPEYVATALRASFDSIRYRGEHTADLNPASSGSRCTPKPCASTRSSMAAAELRGRIRLGHR